MNDRRNLLKESLAAIETLQARLDATERAKSEPIALVGAACRFPGGIEDPEALWRMLRDGVDAVSEVPRSRWDADAYYDPDPKAPGKMITRRGGFLSQVDLFDAQFFGISPREASTLDPQQRLLLETASEALEQAGVPFDGLVGAAVGVFVGITTSDYGQMVRSGGVENADVYSATGNALNAAAGRLSFNFGFQGPCVAVDTACSSSLVAVHLACQSLRAGESNLAIAAGVNVILSPDAMVLFSKWGMMAPDGACKTFDATADGFVRAEGCAAIVLKRLSDAIAEGDVILAVIRGTATNSDGRSSGLTVPNGPAQQQLLERALANAGLQPAAIDYVEAHGTGTSLGDPIEVEALGAVMCRERPHDRPLLIGSIKTNIGHAEAASGLAGLLKVVMALRHEAIPPHLHFSRPNQAIPWDKLSIAVPTALTPWNRGDRPRCAGVSSFGFSGTNAHVILEEAPAPKSPSQGAPPWLVPLSARNDAALRELAARHATALGSEEPPAPADFAVTVSTGRAHLQHRLAIVADTASGLQRDLREFAGGQLPSAVVEGTLRQGERPRIGFLFTGQGSQYVGMGRGLYEREPVFRAVVDKAAGLLAPHLDLPLLDMLFAADESAKVLSQTGYTQPALFTIECALAELWRSWGVTPSIVAGHSVGEYAAACVAGALSFEDGLLLIARRAQLMQQLPAGGAMAAVFTSAREVERHLDGLADRLSIAAINASEETVVSGDSQVLARFLAGLTTAGIGSRQLGVSHAFHSPLLEPMLDALEQSAAEVVHRVPHIALVSNISGGPFPSGATPDAAYWRRHAREPVRFASAIDALRRAEVNIVVEIGPHPTLLALVQRVLPDAKWTIAPSLQRGRDDVQQMLSSLGKLYVRGVNPRWKNVTAGHGRRVPLPTYPFQRERHWVQPAVRRAPSSSRPGHPLLGERRGLASLPGTRVWENCIGFESQPWLRDHCVQRVAVVPATAYLEMAFAAGVDVFGASPVSVRNIAIAKPIMLGQGDERTIQTTVTLLPSGEAEFSVHSQPAGASGGYGWTLHVKAEIVAIEKGTKVRKCPDIEEVRARALRQIQGGEFYGALAAKGNQWGPAFQALKQVWIGADEAIGLVETPELLRFETRHYRFHPAVSDAAGHALVALVPLDHSSSATGGALVGEGMQEVRFYCSPASHKLWTYAKLRPSPDPKGNVVVGDVQVYDESGALVSETLGARLWYLEESSLVFPLAAALDDWYVEAAWREKERSAKTRGSPEGPWLVFADTAGVAASIASSRKRSGADTLLVFKGDKWSFDGTSATIRPDDPADYARLLDAAPSPSAIVYLWGCDDSEPPQSDGRAPRAIAPGAENLLRVLKALHEKRVQLRTKIWIVTRGAQRAVHGDSCEAPLGATLWGIGRSLSVEHTELWGGLIDFAAATPLDLVAEQLSAEVQSADADDKIAFRGAKRLVARLAPRARKPGGEREKFAVRQDATYLITGGLGGLGLEMARWLVECGARHLLLVGRTALPARDTWSALDPESPEGRRVAAVLKLESLGATVELAAVDVAKTDEIKQCLNSRREQGMPDVGGVIHAAGILRFAALETLDPDSLRELLSAKVAGAWALHQLFAKKRLDCFILCSSTSALLNSPLLGGYAAGNAFLDALAHHRRARGLPALSVNWGTWGEVGMAAQAGGGAGRNILKGAKTISTEKGLAALHDLLEMGDTQTAVMPMDWAEFARSYPSLSADPFLEAFVGEGHKDASPTIGFSVGSLANESAESRAQLIGHYLLVEAARVLGLQPERFDAAQPLPSWGFDSLMGVQLKNRIEADLGVTIPMIEFLNGPSIEKLAQTVVEAMKGEAVRSPAGALAASQAWEEGTL